MTQTDTKTRLLDAAESLFSRQGFPTTSLRAITARAGANLAAANYHFGSKEALLKAVLERRLLPLNQLRSDRIDQVLSTAAGEGRRPGTEELLRAFIEPTFAFRRNTNGSGEFVSLVGRSMTSADSIVRNYFLELICPLLKKLHQALCLALPLLPPELIFSRLFFTMGAMGHGLCFAGITQIFNVETACNPEDDAAMTDNLITFVTAGLEAPC